MNLLLQRGAAPLAESTQGRHSLLISCAMHGWTAEAEMILEHEGSEGTYEAVHTDLCCEFLQ